MQLVIPYGIRFNTGGGVEVVPVAYIKIQSTRDMKELLGIFVVDSGASTSLLSSSDAEALGISLYTGEKIIVRGITGHHIAGFRHRVHMNIDGIALRSVPVIFSKEKDAPRVLGREGVFSHFAILFDEAKRRTAFLENRTERKSIDSIFE